MGGRLRMSDTAFYLSDEIIEKIVSRLPLKSLLKCKIVCRPWDSLIRDRHFIYMHLSHSIDNPNYLTGVTNSENLKLYLLEDDGESECKITNIPLPVCKKLKFATFVGSACGWVCLNDLWSDDVHICNPATEQAITLSNDGQQPRIGFGIGQESDEYVVCWIFENIQVNDVNHPYDCEIYSSKTCSWKRICSIPYDIDSYVYAFANGAFHWYNGSDAIISVDIKEEKENVRFTQLPEPIVNAVIFLDEWRGSLAVFVVKGLGVKVWILKDCGESSWTKKWSFSMARSPVWPFTVDSLVVRKNDVLFVTDDRKLLSYNLVCKRWKQFILAKLNAVYIQYMLIQGASSHVSFENDCLEESDDGKQLQWCSNGIIGLYSGFFYM